MSVAKQHALLSQSIKIRSLGVWVAAQATYPIIEIVYRNEKNVGTLLAIRFTGRTIIARFWDSCRRGLDRRRIVQLSHFFRVAIAHQQLAGGIKVSAWIPSCCTFRLYQANRGIRFGNVLNRFTDFITISIVEYFSNNNRQSRNPNILSNAFNKLFQTRTIMFGFLRI